MHLGSEDLDNLASFIIKAFVIVAIILGISFVANQAYKYYKNTHKAPVVKQAINGKLVSAKVKRLSETKAEVKQIVEPDPVRIEVKDGRKVVVHYVQPNNVETTTELTLPKVPVTYALGYFKSPTFEGVGITHGIVQLPAFFDCRLSTGLFCGRDNLDNVRGAWMFTVSKEFMPHLEIALGEMYSLDRGWEGNIGVQYCW